MCLGLGTKRRKQTAREGSDVDDQLPSSDDEVSLTARCENAKARLFYSSLTRARVCGLKQIKRKITEHERVQFSGTTEHERGPSTHATRKKHTLNTRACSIGYH